LARRSGRGRSRRRGGKKKQNQQQEKTQVTAPRDVTGRSESSRKPRPKSKKRVFDPEKHYMPPPVPQREYEPDPITGEPIDNIYTAITEPTTGKPANFDSILKQLEEQEELGPGERIIYVGKGEFGVLQENKSGRKASDQPRFFIRKRITIEDEYEKYEWRKELSPGISRDYTPAPEPLSELFDEAEAIVKDSGFGKAHPSIYLPKTD
jgi:hypothetical protein